MIQYYVGLNTYSHEVVQNLCSSKAVKGIILGDLFCTKRMFNNGIAEEILLMQEIIKAEKEIIFQSPLYITSRNYDEVLSILKMLDSYSINTSAIVHDMGLVHLIHKRFPTIKIIWGRMARTREYHFNDNFFTLLLKEGVCGIETAEIKFITDIKKSNLCPYLVYGNLQYITVGRQCYQMYQGLTCNRDNCLIGRYSLKESESQFCMTINGHILGEKIIYDPAIFQIFLDDQNGFQNVIYADTFNSLMNNLNL